MAENVAWRPSYVSDIALTQEERMDEYANKKFEAAKDAIESLASSATNRRAAEITEFVGIAALVALADHYEGAAQAEFVGKTKAERKLAIAEGVLRAYGYDEEYEELIDRG